MKKAKNFEIERLKNSWIDFRIEKRIWIFEIFEDLRNQEIEKLRNWEIEKLKIKYWKIDNWKKKWEICELRKLKLTSLPSKLKLEITSSPVLKHGFWGCSGQSSNVTPLHWLTTNNSFP